MDAPLIQTVVAAQESAATDLANHMQGGEDLAAARVQPLPLGPKERAYFQADGGVEIGTAEELGFRFGGERRASRALLLRPRPVRGRQHSSRSNRFALQEQRRRHRGSARMDSRSRSFVDGTVVEADQRVAKRNPTTLSARRT